MRLKELALERRRFGYRRLRILLRREGVELSHKKLFRLYREERLTVKKGGGRKRALGTRAPMTLPQGPNQRWSLDFVSDMLADGRRFRVLVMVDDFTRECLALVVDTSLSGMRVARELDTIAESRGRPLMIVSDNGTELTSRATLQWQEDNRVEWHYTAASVTNASTSICSAALQPGPDRPTRRTESSYERGLTRGNVNTSAARAGHGLRRIGSDQQLKSLSQRGIVASVQLGR